jgi:hypothetical protein
MTQNARDLYWLISTSTNVEGFAVQWIERKYLRERKILDNSHNTIELLLIIQVVMWLVVSLVHSGAPTQPLIVRVVHRQFIPLPSLWVHKYWLSILFILSHYREHVGKDRDVAVQGPHKMGPQAVTRVLFPHPHSRVSPQFPQRSIP